LRLQWLVVPVEGELFFAFGVSADSGFFGGFAGFGFAERAVWVLAVGWLGFKYPAATGAFEHCFFGFCWGTRDCWSIEQQDGWVLSGQR
jgi:hypothetical protein